MARLLPRTTHADHPLLTQVAQHAHRTTHATAAAITRAERRAPGDHELIAFSGDETAMDEIATLDVADFPPGEDVVVHHHTTTGLLPLSASVYGTLVVVRPKLRRGHALR